ncbi:MAG: hypothetical protein V4489_08935 [Chlamydiota bacterium]
MNDIPVGEINSVPSSRVVEGGDTSSKIPGLTNLSALKTAEAVENVGNKTHLADPSGRSLTGKRRAVQLER